MNCEIADPFMITLIMIMIMFIYFWLGASYKDMKWRLKNLEDKK